MTSTVQVFDADTLLTCVQRVMAAIVDSGDALPGSTPLPARQIVSTAGVTWDCPMLFVAALEVRLGLPEPVGSDLMSPGVLTYPPQANQTAWNATVEAGVVRQALAQPTVKGPRQASPAVDKYEADLTAVSSDTAVLLNAAQTLGARNFQPVPVDASMLATQGGYHGVAATFTVELWPAP